MTPPDDVSLLSKQRESAQTAMKPAGGTGKTQLCIIGAGPAGLTLHRAMANIGISSLVIEARTRDYVESRVRAGLVEPGIVRLLDDLGASASLRRDAACHSGFILQLDGESHRIPFGDSSGEPVYMYPQQKIVRDLLAFTDEEDVFFNTRVIRIEQNDTSDAAVIFHRDGASFRLNCDFIVGADGAHGISRRTLLDSGTKTYYRDYGIDWLGVLADTAPLADELIYSHTHQGFALHSMRSASQSRLYLQIPRDPGPLWTDEQIWEQIDQRVSGKSGRIRPGPVTERNAFRLSAFQIQTPQYHRLYVIGDAAHTVPPSAAKGLNLAIEDAAHLAQAFTAWFINHDRTPLDTYPIHAHRRAWLTQMFSAEMTQLLHTFPGETDFESKAKHTRWRRIANNAHALRDFSENYVGQARR